MSSSLSPRRLAMAVLAMATPIAYAQSLTSKGCFSSAGSLTNQGSQMFQTTSTCQTTCTGMGASVMGLTMGSTCYCGNSLPPQSDEVEDYECSSPCNGYGQASCGGPSSFGIWLTGLSATVPQDGGSGSDDQSSSQPASSATSKPSSVAASSQPAPSAVITTISASPQIITVGGSTVVSTVPGTVATTIPSVGAAPAETTSATPSDSSSSGLSTGAKVGIAVGVVGGVLVLGALAGGFFYWKKKQNGDTARAGANHKNNASVNGFVSQGAHPAGSNGSISDNRLDPSMVETRRNSDGSMFGDDQDYSRRILKVTNPSRDSRFA